MARKFKELRDKMSDESRARAHELYKKMVAEIEQRKDIAMGFFKGDAEDQRFAELQREGRLDEWYREKAEKELRERIKREVLEELRKDEQKSE